MCSLGSNFQSGQKRSAICAAEIKAIAVESWLTSLAITLASQASAHVSRKSDLLSNGGISFQPATYCCEEVIQSHEQQLTNPTRNKAA